MINTSTGKPVSSSEFMSPDICGGCHAEIFSQWKGSMHSHAFRDPIFQALWKLGSQETKGLTDKLCAGCHTGIGTVSEEIILQDGEFQVSAIAKQRRSVRFVPHRRSINVSGNTNPRTAKRFYCVGTGRHKAGTL